MNNKQRLFVDVGLFGCLLPTVGVAIVVGLEVASNWFYDKDIWILGAIFRVVGGTIGVALVVFFITWLWKTFKGIVLGLKK